MRTATLFGRIADQPKLATLPPKVGETETHQALNFTMYCREKSDPTDIDVTMKVAAYGRLVKKMGKAEVGDQVLVKGIIRIDRTKGGTYVNIIADSIEFGAVGKIKQGRRTQTLARATATV